MDLISRSRITVVFENLETVSFTLGDDNDSYVIVKDVSESYYTASNGMYSMLSSKYVYLDISTKDISDSQLFDLGSRAKDRLLTNDIVSVIIDNKEIHVPWEASDSQYNKLEHIDEDYGNDGVAHVYITIGDM